MPCPVSTELCCSLSEVESVFFGNKGQMHELGLEYGVGEVGKLILVIPVLLAVNMLAFIFSSSFRGAIWHKLGYFYIFSL